MVLLRYESMKKKTLLNGILCAFTLVTALAVSAKNIQADGTESMVNGGKAVLKNYLVMDKEANTPPAVFTYSIQPYSGTIKDGDVKPGIDGAVITETVDFGDTAENNANTDSTSVFDDKDTEKFQAGDGKTSVYKDVIVDFSNVTFTEPGAYRYVIEQSCNNASVTTDQNNRLLDVWVWRNDDTNSENKNKLYVRYYVLYKPDGVDSKVKSFGFRNEYKTNNLTLNKQVTGSLGSYTQEFNFKVNLQGMKDTVYDVVVTNGSETKETKSVTLGSEGTGSLTLQMRHNDKAVIKEIANGTGYSIIETDGKAKGYTPSAYKGSDSKTTIGSSDGDNYTVSEDSLAADTEITFVNQKKGPTLTGIKMNRMPVVMIMLSGAAGLLFIMIGRRRDQES